jgi:hypothetical protein
MEPGQERAGALCISPGLSDFFGKPVIASLDKAAHKFTNTEYLGSPLRWMFCVMSNVTAPVSV